MSGRRPKKPKALRPRRPDGSSYGSKLREALRPFAEVDFPAGGDGVCVWFYVGKPLGVDHGHLNLEDFRRARRALK